MNCPKCENKGTLYIRENFPLEENTFEVKLACEACRWESVPELYLYDNFSHYTDCNCKKCELPARIKFIEETEKEIGTALNAKIQWYGTPPPTVLGWHREYEKDFLKCDCGAQKAKTTHANWCSTK